MKKIFTLTMLLVLAMTVNAQETTYRKSWDFTKWSPTTVANLLSEATKGVSGGAWSDIEKSSGTAPTELSKDNCFWEVKHQGNATEGATLMANGEVIPELEGLLYTNTADRSLAIAVNYQVANASDAAFGPYNGASYLWLGSKTKNYFVIPHVAPGTTIKMGVESHKMSDARGVELYVGWGNSGTKLNGPDGNPVAVPTSYQDQEWLVPADVEAANEDGTVDITIRNTNGCHLYYITVGEGDAPVTEEAKKVAFIGTNDDFALTMFDASVIDAQTVEGFPSLSELQENYDALVVGTTATAEQLAAVKNIIAFFPVVNTNPALYETLGLGSAAEAADPVLTITDTGNSIFEGLDEAIETAGISALTLGDYFAQDNVLAKAGDAVAIHSHNAGRNAYYFIPVDEATEALYTLLSNAIVAASKTKRAVAAVSTPTISFTQADGVSTVTIAAANSDAIYYTLDGTEPTINSTLYTEKFDVTSDVTVKAFAIGDGYTDSQVASKEVKIATQIAAPTITIAREQGKSTITISGADGAKLYYNFDGSKTAALSSAYSAPIEITEPTTIYALATADGSLPSEVVSQFIGVDGVDATNIRMDVIAHFDANQDDWFINNAEVLPDATGSASAYYFWGKSAWNYYSTEVDHEETVKDSQGNDSTVIVYKADPAALKVVNPLNDNGWVLKSQGQVLTGELQLAPLGGVGNGEAGRYFDEAADAMPAGINNAITKGVITFGAKTSGEPYTGRIESTVKYAGPFDVVVFCGNGNGSGKGEMEIQTSTDGETWTTLQALNLADMQRYIKRTKASYEATDEVYVRVAQMGGGSKAQVYDIYLLNNGEQSKQYSEQTVGISNATVAPAVKVAAIYSINGARQQSLKKGLNIVVENGVARKVLVK